jgi:hypothetical protein
LEKDMTAFGRISACCPGSGHQSQANEGTEKSEPTAAEGLASCRVT